MYHEMFLSLLFSSFLLLHCEAQFRNPIRLTLTEFNEQLATNDRYPSCVDVVDVRPPPNSILEPFNQEDLFGDYAIQVKYSRPYSRSPLGNASFKGVWFARPEKGGLILSVSTTNIIFNNDTIFSPYHVQALYGSEMSHLYIFRLPISLRYVP